MGIKYKRKDYILIDVAGKAKLGKVAMANDTGGTIVLEEALGQEEGTISSEFKTKEVIANLGRNPRSGKAFGANIEPYKQSMTHKKIGQLDIFRELTEKDVTRIYKALDAAYKLFKKKASVHFLPIGKSTELRAPKGKMVGSYKFKHKKDENQDVMTLCPLEFSDSKYNLYVVCHELAHGLWFRCVPSNVKANWIKLYEKRMVVKDISKTNLKSLLREVQSYQCDIKSYIREMGDEDTTVILKEVMKHIKRMHRLDAHELYMACADDKQLLADVWPSRAQLSEPMADVSDYALKSVAEFFAESVSLSFTGTKLPKDVEKELKNTMGRLTIIHTTI